MIHKALLADGSALSLLALAHIERHDDIIRDQEKKIATLSAEIDFLADRIEVLENKIAKAVEMLQSIRDIDGELYKVVAELEGKE